MGFHITVTFFFFILDHDWASCDVCFCLHVRFKVSTGKLSPFSRGMWKQSCSSPSDSAQWSSNIQVKSQAAKQDFLRGILKGKHQFYTSGSVYSTFGAFCLCVCLSCTGACRELSEVWKNNPSDVIGVIPGGLRDDTFLTKSLGYDLGALGLKDIQGGYNGAARPDFFRLKWLTCCGLRTRNSAVRAVRINCRRSNNITTPQVVNQTAPYYTLNCLSLFLHLILCCMVCFAVQLYKQLYKQFHFSFMRY